MKQKVYYTKPIQKPSVLFEKAGIACIFLLPVLFFAVLAREIRGEEHLFFDTILLRWIYSFHSPAFDTFFLFFTSLGNPSILLPIVLLIAGYLVYRKYYVRLFLLLFSVGGASVINLILKVIFQRDRPALWQTLITETDYSFPSGHAMASSAFILCLILALWHTKWRLFALISGGILLVTIGLSRLYLGVHYPSDILAGWAVSTAWAAVVAWASKRSFYLRSLQQSRRGKP